MIYHDINKSTVFSSLTNNQILALDCVFASVDYDKVPEDQYKRLHSEMLHLEKQIAQELKKRGL